MSFVINFLMNLFLSTFKLCISLAFLLCFSVSLYTLFYQWYIPRFFIIYQIYFQHDVACHQLATTSSVIGFNGDSTACQHSTNSLKDCQFVHYDLYCNNKYFQTSQIYDFELNLQMPDSYVNQNLGMFMIRLRLFDVDEKQLFTIARPAIYPYKSNYIRIIKLFAHLLFYLFGYTESYWLNINLIDQHVNNIDILQFDNVYRIRVEIETYKSIEIIPPSQLRITARLEGIKYWMYFWPVTTFIVSTTVIFFTLVLMILLLNIIKMISTKHINNVDHPSRLHLSMETPETMQLLHNRD